MRLTSSVSDLTLTHIPGISSFALNGCARFSNISSFRFHESFLEPSEEQVLVNARQLCDEVELTEEIFDGFLPVKWRHVGHLRASDAYSSDALGDSLVLDRRVA